MKSIKLHISEYKMKNRKKKIGKFSTDSETSLKAKVVFNQENISIVFSQNCVQPDNIKFGISSIDSYI